jgi:hypothetical protein
MLCLKKLEYNLNSFKNSVSVFHKIQLCNNQRFIQNLKGKNYNELKY